jgi:hypothetical protein
VLFTVFVLPATPSQAAGADDKVNPTAEALKQFSDRLKDYVALQKKLASALPTLKPSNDPADAEAHRKALAAAIQKARQTATPGEIFGSAAGIFQGLIREDAQDRTRRDVYAALEEVPTRQPPAVNAEYPEKAPLATVPPLLLTKFPRLPDGLEYRFMGRDLVLRDSESNLLVDFIHDAVPILVKNAAPAATTGKKPATTSKQR